MGKKNISIFKPYHKQQTITPDKDPTSVENVGMGNGGSVAGQPISFLKLGGGIPLMC